MYKTISLGFVQTERIFETKEECKEFVKNAYFMQDIYMLENGKWKYIGSQIF